VKLMKTNIEVVERICAILDKERPRGDGKSYAQQTHGLRYVIWVRASQNGQLVSDHAVWAPAAGWAHPCNGHTQMAVVVRHDKEG
jgi:hypothetical protein